MEEVSDIAAEIAWKDIVAGKARELAVVEQPEQGCCMGIAVDSSLAEEPDRGY